MSAATPSAKTPSATTRADAPAGFVGRLWERAYERVRCVRHNLLHLREFHLSYRPPLWRVRDRGGLALDFPFYPYISCYDLEGYLAGGRLRPRPGDVVVDAGGCFGEYALYAAKLVGPAGRVLMLEPDPKNAEIARKLFALNGSPSNLDIVPAGLWHSRTTLRFRTGHDAVSTVVAAGEPAGEDVIEIPTHSFQSLIDTYRLDRLDLVKMDIEGAEIEAMRPFSELPQHYRPRFAIASYHLVDGRQTCEALEAQLRGLGYRVETGNPHHLTTWAWPEGGPELDTDFTD